MQPVFDFLAHWLLPPDPLDPREFIFSWYAVYYTLATLAGLLLVDFFIVAPFEARLAAPERKRAAIEYRFSLPPEHPDYLPPPRVPDSPEGRDYWRRYLPEDDPDYLPPTPKR